MIPSSLGIELNNDSSMYRTSESGRFEADSMNLKNVNSAIHTVSKLSALGDEILKSLEEEDQGDETAKQIDLKQSTLSADMKQNNLYAIQKKLQTLLGQDVEQNEASVKYQKNYVWPNNSEHLYQVDPRIVPQQYMNSQIITQYPSVDSDNLLKFNPVKAMEKDEHQIYNGNKFLLEGEKINFIAQENYQSSFADICSENANKMRLYNLSTFSDDAQPFMMNSHAAAMELRALKSLENRAFNDCLGDHPTDYSRRFAEQAIENTDADEPIDYSMKFSEANLNAQPSSACVSTSIGAIKLNYSGVYGNDRDDMRTFATEGTPQTLPSKAASLADLSSQMFVQEMIYRNSGICSDNVPNSCRLNKNECLDLTVNRPEIGFSQYSKISSATESVNNAARPYGRDNFSQDVNYTTNYDAFARNENSSAVSNSRNVNEDRLSVYKTEGSPVTYANNWMQQQRHGEKDPNIIEMKFQNNPNHFKQSEQANISSRQGLDFNNRNLINNGSNSTNSSGNMYTKLPTNNTTVSSRGNSMINNTAMNNKTLDRENQEIITPMMFSRSSSLSSLNSFDVHSIHSSLMSEYSRRTSEAVSPSDLPDSPGSVRPTRSLRVAWNKTGYAPQPLARPGLDCVGNKNYTNRGESYLYSTINKLENMRLNNSQPNDASVYVHASMSSYLNDNCWKPNTINMEPVKPRNELTSYEINGLPRRNEITTNQSIEKDNNVNNIVYDEKTHNSKDQPYIDHGVTASYETSSTLNKDQNKEVFEDDDDDDFDDDDDSLISESDEIKIAEVISLALPPTKRTARSASRNVVANTPRAVYKLEAIRSDQPTATTQQSIMYQNQSNNVQQSVKSSGSALQPWQGNRWNSSYSNTSASRSQSVDRGMQSLNFRYNPRDHAVNNQSYRFGGMTRDGGGVDLMKTYAVEDTPLTFSRSTSLSNLTVDSSSHDYKSNKLIDWQENESKEYRGRTLQNSGVRLRQSSDNIKRYCVEDTPAVFSRNDSLSSLDADEYLDGEQANLSFRKPRFLGSTSTPMGKQRVVKNGDIVTVSPAADGIVRYAVEGSPALIASPACSEEKSLKLVDSPLSSLSLDSLILEPREVALLEECINAAMPQSRNRKRKAYVTVSATGQVHFHQLAKSKGVKDKSMQNNSMRENLLQQKIGKGLKVEGMQQALVKTSAFSDASAYDEDLASGPSTEANNTIIYRGVADSALLDSTQSILSEENLNKTSDDVSINETCRASNELLSGSILLNEAEENSKNRNNKQDDVLNVDLSSDVQGNCKTDEIGNSGDISGELQSTMNPVTVDNGLSEASEHIGVESTSTSITQLIEKDVAAEGNKVEETEGEVMGYEGDVVTASNLTQNYEDEADKVDVNDEAISSSNACKEDALDVQVKAEPIATDPVTTDSVVTEPCSKTLSDSWLTSLNDEIPSGNATDENFCHVNYENNLGNLSLDRQVSNNVVLNEFRNDQSEIVEQNIVESSFLSLEVPVYSCVDYDLKTSVKSPAESLDNGAEYIEFQVDADLSTKEATVIRDIVDKDEMYEVDSAESHSVLVVNDQPAGQLTGDEEIDDIKSSNHTKKWQVANLWRSSEKKKLKHNVPVGAVSAEDLINEQRLDDMKHDKAADKKLKKMKHYSKVELRVDMKSSDVATVSKNESKNANRKSLTFLKPLSLLMGKKKSKKEITPSSNEGEYQSDACVKDYDKYADDSLKFCCETLDAVNVKQEEINELTENLDRETFADDNVPCDRNIKDKTEEKPVEIALTESTGSEVCADHVEPHVGNDEKHDKKGLRSSFFKRQKSKDKLRDVLVEKVTECDGTSGDAIVRSTTASMSTRKKRFSMFRKE